MAQCVFELWVRERGAEVCDRLPKCVVHEYIAACDALMQLRGDVARLLLHPIRVRLPRLHQGWDVGLSYMKYVNQNDWRDFGIDLLKDRDVLVEWFELKHLSSPWRLNLLGDGKNLLLCCLTFELSCLRRQPALGRGRQDATGAWSGQAPAAVAGQLERGVRRHRASVQLHF